MQYMNFEPIPSYFLFGAENPFVASILCHVDGCLRLTKDFVTTTVGDQISGAKRKKGQKMQAPTHEPSAVEKKKHGMNGKGQGARTAQHGPTNKPWAKAKERSSKAPPAFPLSVAHRFATNVRHPTPRKGRVTDQRRSLLPSYEELPTTPLNSVSYLTFSLASVRFLSSLLSQLPFAASSPSLASVLVEER